MTGADDGDGAVWFAALPKEARKYQGRSAGLVSRALANAVDVAIVVLILSAAYLGWAAVRYSVDPVRFTFPAPARGAVLAAALGMSVAYLVLSWTAAGRTFGDQLLGLRVTDRRGRPLRLGRALVRSIACVLVPVGLLWVLVGTRRRSAQDVLLRTRVVYDWNPHLHPVRTSPGTSDAGDVDGTPRWQRQRRGGGDRS